MAKRMTPYSKVPVTFQPSLPHSMIDGVHETVEWIKSQ